MKNKIKQLGRRLGIECVKLGGSRRGIVLEDDLRYLETNYVLKSKTCIFDVGANQGQTVKRFRSAFPKAVIHAFEPVSSTYALLRNNVGHLPNVTLHNLALSDFHGNALMTAEAGSGINHILIDDAPIGTATESVKVTTVDSQCERLAITDMFLLKTDCEGFDLEALKGSTRLLQAGRIGAVLSEVSAVGSDSHADFFQTHAFLDSVGLKFYGLYDYSGRTSFPKHAFMNSLWISPTAFAA
jgi:FkbM family methyltransferase